jgi:urocanate hydratase
LFKVEKPVKCLTGPKLHCRNWQIKGILRMLFNVVDPDVTKDPERLIVYGGTGRAARSWRCFESIVETLTKHEPDETMLVQSGKPIAVFKTHKWAPRARAPTTEKTKIVKACS